jgi:WD40 repeat protein
MWHLRVCAACLALAACGSPGPQKAVSGPRLGATLAAVWPTSGPPRQAAFSRDGKLAALADASGAIVVRNVRDWSIAERLSHDGGATSVVFSKDGTHLFSGGYDGNVREWDLARHNVAQLFKGGRRVIWTIDVSPDGKQLAAAGEDAVIRLWNVNEPAKPALLRGHTRNIWEVRFSPDGQRLASGSFDDSVRLWDAKSARPLKTLSGHSQAVVGLDFSPDGKLLATGADDSTIRYWRASDGAPLRTIENGTHVDKVAFSPDGRWLASGGHPRGQVGEVWHQLTGGGASGDAVRIWRVKDGALVAGLPHPDDAPSVAFSRDGHWLVTAGEDGRFRLWRLQLRG